MDKTLPYTSAMEKNWAGLPFYPISHHYNKLFGEKVYKIPVSIVDDCPNRMGLKGMQTCIFCDEWGSAAHKESLTMDLKEQIETYQKSIGKRFNSKKFLVYFQAYTNTFAKISTLQANFATSLEYDFVKGFVIGTRPDCISPAVIRLWNEYHEKSHVAVEFGVQSFFDDQLEFLRRGHTREQSLKGILNIAKETNVDIGIHLIFGLPSETEQHIIETAEIINALPITNVKLHNLHALKNTPLEKMYNEGLFKPICLEKYAEHVRIFLQHLSPKVAIQRLAALASRWDELVAPDWTGNKMGTHQYIIDHIRAHKSYQSELYFTTNEEEQFLREHLKNQSLPVLY
jgi:radical SAM protein (TIGR01212 family)